MALATLCYWLSKLPSTWAKGLAKDACQARLWPSCRAWRPRPSLPICFLGFEAAFSAHSCAQNIMGQGLGEGRLPGPAVAQLPGVASKAFFSICFLGFEAAFSAHSCAQNIMGQGLGEGRLPGPAVAQLPGVASKAFFSYLFLGIRSCLLCPQLRAEQHAPRAWRRTPARPGCGPAAGRGVQGLLFLSVSWDSKLPSLPTVARRTALAKDAFQPAAHQPAGHGPANPCCTGLRSLSVTLAASFGTILVWNSIGQGWRHRSGRRAKARRTRPLAADPWRDSVEEGLENLANTDAANAAPPKETTLVRHDASTLECVVYVPSRHPSFLSVLMSPRCELRRLSCLALSAFSVSASVSGKGNIHNDNNNHIQHHTTTATTTQPPHQHQHNAQRQEPLLPVHLCRYLWAPCWPAFGRKPLESIGSQH